MARVDYKKITISVLLFIVLCVVVVATNLVLSMPVVKGKINIPELQGEVIVNRDKADMLTIIGDSRLDISIAMGFVHAQERFFQMDLLRRSASGELAEIFGSQLVDFDKSRRIHRFRDISNKILAGLSDYEREILTAYTDGVNAGLRALRSSPIEYKLLFQDPRPWTLEDSILVGLNMYFELQYPNAEPCILRGMIQDHLQESLSEFLLHQSSKWDSHYFQEESYDIQMPIFKHVEEKESAVMLKDNHPKMKGSNQWAKRQLIDGKAEASIACDMHLGLSVPNIWYMVTIVYNDQEFGKIEASGATIPGNPCIVIGTNKNVAWGFTNAYFETSGLILLEKGSESKSYITHEGEKNLIELTEIIQVRGEKNIPFRIKWTDWGPLRTKQYDRYDTAISWCAYSSDSFNLGLLNMEKVKTVLEGFKVCEGVRIPVQNCVLADSQGNIGWCIAGKLPEHKFYRPKKSSEVICEYNQIMAEVYSKKIYNPPSGLICTANNKILPEQLIPGCYLNPIRAYQIKKKLESTKASFSTISKTIQSDNRALFMDRWYKLMLEVIPLGEEWDELRRELGMWDGRCSKNSRGYCLIRSFREKCYNMVLKRLLSPCLARDPGLDITVCDFEEPVFKYLQLNFFETSGKEFEELKNTLTTLLKEIVEEHSNCICNKLTWGSHDQTSVRHPLSLVIKVLSPLLDMKGLPLDGDYFVPKVLSLNEGASIKLIVSFERETHAIVSLPVGQSGHPLSRSYRIFHKMWANDEYISLFPESPTKTLELHPAN